MEALTTAIVAWTALDFYLAIYYALLCLRRRETVHLLFSSLMAATGAHALGQAILTGAETLETGTIGASLALASLGLGLVAFVRLANSLTTRPSRTLVRLAEGWTMVGLVLLATGLLLEDARGPTPPLYLSWALVYAQPTCTVPGFVYLAGVWVLCLDATRRLLLDPQTSVDIRIMAATGVIVAGAGVHDIAIRMNWLGSVYLMEHVSVIAGTTLHTHLLVRFVRTRSELSRRTRQLVQSYVALQQSQKRLVRAEQLAAVGELSAVIAHEVRNPLAVIKNAVSRLRRPTTTPADQNTLLEILEEECDRLRRLVRDLLTYAQPATHRGDLIDVRSLLEGALRLAGSAHPASEGITVEMDLGDGLPTLHGDPELLKLAVFNVLDNAFSALSPGDHLRIRCRVLRDDREPRVRLFFEDSGPGMDPEVASKAQDPFFTTKPAGTGLGLAIVDRVMKSHSGSLSIESTPGTGTTVTLDLPVEPPERASQEAIPLLTELP